MGFRSPAREAMLRRAYYTNLFQSSTTALRGANSHSGLPAIPMHLAYSGVYREMEPGTRPRSSRKSTLSGRIHVLKCPGLVVLDEKIVLTS